MPRVCNFKKPLHQLRRTLAKYWLKLYPQITVIGITGSYGKTNTTRAIATVLGEKYKTLQTDLNLDTVYNLPITILKLRPGVQKLVLEYGVDHKNEMDFHLSLVKPTVAVITGINPTHSEPELLGSVEGIIEEKSKLIQTLPESGWGIFNRDDENVRQMTKKTKAKVLSYGTSVKCDFWAEKIKANFSGTEFLLHYKNETIFLKTGLVGAHFVHSCLAAVAVAKIECLSWQEIKNGLLKLHPLAGRLSIEKGPKGSILLNDALRANPASTLAGLKVLVSLPTKGKRVAVLGEMGELGILAEKEHRRIGQELAKLKIDYFVSIGPLQRLTVQEAIKGGMKKEQVFWVENVEEAANVLRKILKKNDLLYLKGSLLRHLERVPLILRGEKVGCQITSCHFYNQCETCPYLLSGL